MRVALGRKIVMGETFIAQGRRTENQVTEVELARQGPGDPDVDELTNPQRRELFEHESRDGCANTKSLDDSDSFTRGGAVAQPHRVPGVGVTQDAMKASF